MLTSSSATGTLKRFDAVVSVVRAERTLTDEQNFDRSATSGVSIPSREVIFLHYAFTCSCVFECARVFLCSHMRVRMYSCICVCLCVSERKSVCEKEKERKSRETLCERQT